MEPTKLVLVPVQLADGMPHGTASRATSCRTNPPGSGLPKLKSGYQILYNNRQSPRGLSISWDVHIVDY